METNKVVVVLLVIAILFSVATVAIALGINLDGLVPAGNGSNTVIERNNDGPASGSVGFTLTGGAG